MPGYGRDQYAPPAPDWRDDSAGYSAEYGAQGDGWSDERTVGGYRGQEPGGWRDQREGRGGYPAGGYRGGQGKDRGYDGGERGSYAGGAPVEDSWAGPAVGGGYWEPSEEVAAAPARRGERRGSRAPGRSGGRTSRQRTGGRNGSPALVIALVAVILAVLVGGAALKFAGFIGRGGTGVANCPPTAAAQAPGPAPATPSQYKAYTSPTSGFTLSYPQQWVQSSETATGATGDFVDRFSTSDAKSSLAVEQAGGFAAECDSQIIDSEVTGGQQDGSTFVRTTSPVATMSIGGVTWQRRDYDVTLKAGGKVHMAILSAHHAGKGYAIVMYSVPETFTADEKATFAAMLNAFRFVG